MADQGIARDDPRVLALREVAGDDTEYSGWVRLAQGALDVLAEREAEISRYRKTLEKIAGAFEAPSESEYMAAIGAAPFDAKAALDG